MGCSFSCGCFHAALLLSFKESFENDMNEPNQHQTTGANPEDNRQTVRYPITGMVQFKWQAVDGQSYHGIGLTRDIGRGGVFIESDSIPPIGSILIVTVTLPAEPMTTVTLQLAGAGVVRNVRQDSSQTIGFRASAVFHLEVPTSTK
jgi:hypothetical protein